MWTKQQLDIVVSHAQSLRDHADQEFYMGNDTLLYRSLRLLSNPLSLQRIDDQVINDAWLMINNFFVGSGPTAFTEERKEYHKRVDMIHEMHDAIVESRTN